MNKIRISVVVPVYNVAQYVTECLQSLFDQTYKEFEVVVVDDCGSDNSMDKVRECIVHNGFNNCGHDNRECYHSPDNDMEVIIVAHTSNQGLSAARNTGIRNASGDYFFFLDSDDKVMPNCLELLNKQIKIHLGGVDMVQCGMKGEDPVKNRYFHDFIDYQHVPLYMEGRRCRSILYGRKLGMMANGRMASRQFIFDNNLFFKPGIIHEDDEWTFRTAKYINSYAYIPEEIFFYRCNYDGIMAHANSKKAYTSLCGIADEILDQLPPFHYYFTELLYAIREMNIAWENAGVNPLDHMKYGKNVLIRAIYRHWRGGKIMKVATFFLCGTLFWTNRFFIKR